MFIGADGRKLALRRIDEQLQNYSKVQMFLYNKLKVKSVEGGSLGWTQGDMDSKKLPSPPSLDINYPTSHVYL